MSTRKGTAVFLSDILDEARDRMMEKMQQTATTKVSADEFETTADILAISAVFINDLKNKKTRNYDFSWEKTLKNEGDSGIRLQYTHARLSNLIANNSNLTLPSTQAEVEQLNIELLSEPEAANLILTIAQFEECLAESYEHLEPSMLVKYLFKLCKDTSKALKVLQVKDNENEETAILRLTLFSVTKNILGYSMRILGLQPLDKM